jgi:AcrR family transcriptional regulator
MSQTPAKPRQARAERTRAVILEAAAVAFAEGGYDGVSMNDLVRASGLTKGAFYFHFPSKDELALAAFRTKQVELVTRVGEATAGATTATERLRGLLVHRARLLREDPSLRIVARLGAELNVRSGPGSEYATFQHLALDLLQGLIEEGQRSGEFRAGLDPSHAAGTLFALIVGLDTLSLLDSSGEDIADRTDAALELVMPAFAAADPPKARRRST